MSNRIRCANFQLQKRKDGIFRLCVNHEGIASDGGAVIVGDRIDLIKLRNYLEKEIDKQYGS